MSAAGAFPAARSLRRLDAARSCGHKHKHSSPAKALAQIRSLTQRYGHEATERMVAYLCRFCKAWHVGHQTKLSR